MGLILNRTLPKFIIGYPTVSDKYNVLGGILTGDDAVHFGDLVKYTDTPGYFKAITGTIALSDIAGFVLATNVKLAEGFPGNEVLVKPQDAFNLVLNGYLAVKLDSSADVADILPNKPVAVFLDTAGKEGKLTTSGVTGATDLDGVVFTGEIENIGTAAAPEIVAEIIVK